MRSIPFGTTWSPGENTLIWMRKKRIKEKSKCQLYISCTNGGGGGGGALLTEWMNTKCCAVWSIILAEGM